MREIPSEYTRGGFTYLLRGVAYTPSTVGGVAIYEQRVGPRLVAYEVVVARYRENATRFGRDFPEGYYLPTPSRWGTDGFTFLPSQEGEAKKRFYELVDREREKEEL